MAPAVKVACITLTSGSNQLENLRQCTEQIESAAKQGAAWVVLPEMLNYMGNYGDLNEEAAKSGAFLSSLASCADRWGIHLFAGSVCEVDAGSSQKLAKNVGYVFDPNGDQIARYEKVHLFSFMDQDGRPSHSEADAYNPGAKCCVFQLESWRVGLAICYDLRFPAFFEKMIRGQAIDVLVVPAAFTLETGQDHWLLLLRARAVELQCYVLASNQTGDHGNGKQSFGHSVIIDPWGRVVADGGEGVGVITSTINKENIEKIRQRLPALKGRRWDLY